MGKIIDRVRRPRVKPRYRYVAFIRETRSDFTFSDGVKLLPAHVRQGLGRHFLALTSYRGTFLVRREDWMP